MKCKCGSDIPQARLDLGYTVCVNCSTVSPYGCVDSIYHKTGNSIEILSKEDAEKIRKITRRRGYGTLLR